MRQEAMTLHPVSPIVLSTTSGSGCSLGLSASTVEASSAKSSIDSMVEDQLVAIFKQESCYRVEVIPCTAGDEVTSSSSRLPYEEWRRKICEWCYKVVDHFRIEREVVGVALNFFDRFLFVHKTCEAVAASTCRCPSCQRAVDSSTFQLGAMTALYLAIKLHADPEDDPVEEKTNKRKLRLFAFVELSRGQFTAEDIISMERKMLDTLQWRVNPPTPMTVVSHLLRLMPKRSLIPFHCRYNYDLVLHVIHELSRYLTELSVCLANVSTVSLPSEVAFASILVSMDMLTIVALPTQVRDDFHEAVTQVSTMNARLDKIRYLKGRLRSCFSPDMLIDDCDIDKQHPISVARESGLLDMSALLRYRPPSIRKQNRIPSATSVMLRPDMQEEEGSPEDFHF